MYELESPFYRDFLKFDVEHFKALWTTYFKNMLL